MSGAATIIRRSVLIGGVLVATALGAEAATVSRCNVLVDGTFVPSLMVEINGSSEIIQIGERGLTRTIVFDADRAIAWAMAQINGNASWVAGSSCGDDFAYDDSSDNSGDDDGCGGL